MEPLIKNLPHAQPFPLKDQVGYEPGKVVSLTLAQRPLRSPLTVSRTRWTPGRLSSCRPASPTRSRP